MDKLVVLNTGSRSSRFAHFQYGLATCVRPAPATVSPVYPSGKELDVLVKRAIAGRNTHARSIVLPACAVIHRQVLLSDRRWNTTIPDGSSC